MSDEELTGDDLEMANAFADEMKEIKGQLDPIYSSLKGNPSQPKQFEQFGQIIDRVYGTAASLGHDELANYCRMLKAITYKCSQSNNLYAQNQVISLMTVALAQLGRFIDSVHKPKQVRALKPMIRGEMAKAEQLAKNAFRNIKRASVA